MASKRLISECTIRRNPDGRWIAQPTIKLSNGKTKRKTIIGRDRDAVKAKLLDIQNQQLKMIPFSPDNWTVGDYLDYWLKDVMPYKIRPSTIEGYERSIRLYIKPKIGNKKLNALGVRDVTAALDALERERVPGRTRQRFKQTLSSCLSHAMREELIFRNVAKTAKMPVAHPKPVTPWNAAQAWYFLDKVKDDEHYLKYLVLLIYGPRAGEVFGLRWSDIDFRNDTMVIRQQITRVRGKLLLQTVKTDASRRPLPLVPIIKQAFLEYAQKQGVELPPFDPNRELTTDGLIFTTQFGTPIDSNNFRKRNFYKMADKYGLPRIRLHDTRHTAATLLKDMGMPVKDVQEILGHTDIATTLKIYEHGSEYIKRRGLTMLSEGLTGFRTFTPDETGAENSSRTQISHSNGEILSPGKRPPLLKVINNRADTRAYEKPETCSPESVTSVNFNSEHGQLHSNTF